MQLRSTLHAGTVAAEQLLIGGIAAYDDDLVVLVVVGLLC
jgi:hypothetical protein